MVIPAEITAKNGVSQEDVFRKGPSAKGIEDAVFDFATIANDNMITAREMFKEGAGKVPRDAMPVFGAGASDSLLTKTRGPTLILLTGAHRIVSGEVRGSKLQCLPLIAAAKKLEVTVASLAKLLQAYILDILYNNNELWKRFCSVCTPHVPVRVS
jgi:hypothetical protein